MRTGMIDATFAPQLNGNVLALAPGPDGASVFAGGEFGTVNGVNDRHLVRLRLQDGQPVTTFKSNANSRVQDLELNHGWLYVSGKFSQLKSLPRSGLARVDPETGNDEAVQRHGLQHGAAQRDLAVACRHGDRGAIDLGIPDQLLAHPVLELIIGHALGCLPVPIGGITAGWSPVGRWRSATGR